MSAGRAIIRAITAAAIIIRRATTARGYYGGRGYRCGSGTTGAIVGGAAGALIGREIGRDGRGYRYRGRNSGTTGAIIGGAIGALIGREATRC